MNKSLELNFIEMHKNAGKCLGQGFKCHCKNVKMLVVCGEGSKMQLKIFPFRIQENHEMKNSCWTKYSRDSGSEPLWF